MKRGTSLTSSVTPGITYDSRDHFFAPTEGTKSGFPSRRPGLGGDSRFIKTDLSGRWHYPLLKDPKWGGNYVPGSRRAARYGIGFAGQSETNGLTLPLFERYFLGGINSIRGFQDRSLGSEREDLRDEPRLRGSRLHGKTMSSAATQQRS
jgi:outer membrane protein insertion porin family